MNFERGYIESQAYICEYFIPTIKRLFNISIMPIFFAYLFRETVFCPLCKAILYSRCTSLMLLVINSQH